MTTPSSPTVTIEVQPPPIVQQGSAISPKVKAKLQLSSDSYPGYGVDNIFATAVVRDTNGNPIDSSDYQGGTDVQQERAKTAGEAEDSMGK
ncbi:uncharacterized protein B0H64DRAFT_441749 [Chaetomium fimeti]|uniref:Uncharacterized protein n=1 Tax=Chaetomium fimeti TaxID=1854472 RepID=A0AAE0HGP7_9PEZI|nr:hypothetical protein B0H64DRAFT_441749 [Chaetomium fimeti]